MYDIIEQSFVHIVYICWTLSAKQIIKRVSLKKVVKIKNYDHIYSLLDGLCTLNSWLFSAKMLYSLRHVLTNFLKLTKGLHHLLRNFRTSRFLSKRLLDQTFCNGNPTGNYQPFFFWHDKNFYLFFRSYILCRGPNKPPFKTSKKISEIWLLRAKKDYYNCFIAREIISTSSNFE